MVSQKPFFKRYSLNNILVRSFENSRMLSALSLRSPVNRAMHAANTRFLGVDPHCWDFSASPSKGRFRTESMFKEYLSSETVVLVREAPALAPVGEQGRRRRDHLAGALPGAEQWPRKIAPWSGRVAVLVTTLDPMAFPAETNARLYRERADAENIYDELKNQWGWNGLTTRKLAPCRLIANMVALVYNWWHLYVRLYDAEHHREAITSRPALLGGVARMTRHSG